MSRITKLALAGALLLTALGASGTATAQSFQIRNGGNITAASLGRVTFRGSDLASPSCAVQLRGTLVNGVVPKVAGTQIGSITGITVSNCGFLENGAGLNPPWRIVYDSIEGTLPNAVTAANIRIVDTQFSTTAFVFATCLYRGDATARIALSGSNPYTTGLIPSTGSATNSIPRFSGGGACPAAGWLDGTFGLTPTQTLTRS